MVVQRLHVIPLQIAQMLQTLRKQLRDAGTHGWILYKVISIVLRARAILHALLDTRKAELDVWHALAMDLPMVRTVAPVARTTVQVAGV
jgi:hypothetical protein